MWDGLGGVFSRSARRPEPGGLKSLSGAPVPTGPQPRVTVGKGRPRQLGLLTARLASLRSQAPLRAPWVCGHRGSGRSAGGDPGADEPSARTWIGIHHKRHGLHGAVRAAGRVGPPAGGGHGVRVLEAGTEPNGNMGGDPVTLSVKPTGKPLGQWVLCRQRGSPGLANRELPTLGAEGHGEARERTGHRRG